MKLFMVVTLFTGLFVVTFADEMIGVFKHPDHPGKCVYDNLVLSPGSHGQPQGKCARFSCNNEEGFATLQGCAKQGAGPSCHLGDLVNANGQYPDCCERHVICDSE